MATLLGQGTGMAIAKESVYGTAVTTTRGVPIISENLRLEPGRVRSTAQRGTSGVLPLHSNTRNGPIQGAGPIQTQLYDSGATLLWEAMLGGISTAGADPYTHTATLEAILPSYSAQIAYGRVTATRVKKVEGLMVRSWELAASANQYLTLGLETVFENADEVVVGEADDDLAGTYPADQIAFLATEVAVTFGGVSTCVESFRLRGDNTLKVAHCLGTRFVTKPTRDGPAALTGEIVVKLDDTDNTFYDAFVAATLLDLSVVATAGANTCTIAATAVPDGSSAAMSGLGELMLTVPFTVEVDDAASEGDDDAFSAVVVNSDSIA